MGMPKAPVLFVPITSLVLIACFEPLFARNEAHHRIDEITLAIKYDPGNTDLYFERGKLYRLSSHLDLALSDFDHVALSDPNHQTVNFHSGHLLLETGEHQQARIALSQFLGVHPRHLQGLIARARVLRKLDQPLQALQDYAHALSLVRHPAPVLLIEQAETLVEAGEEYVDSAIESLDEAIRKYGPLILLESCAVDIDLERQHYDAALTRIDRVLSVMTRKEKWLVRRAEILEKAGRIEEAGATYEDALRAIEALPDRLQQIPASQALAASTWDFLERCNL